MSHERGIHVCCGVVTSGLLGGRVPTLNPQTTSPYPECSRANFYPWSLSPPVPDPVLTPGCDGEQERRRTASLSVEAPSQTPNPERRRTSVEAASLTPAERQKRRTASLSVEAPSLTPNPNKPTPNSEVQRRRTASLSVEAPSLTPNSDKPKPERRRTASLSVEAHSLTPNPA